MATPERRGAVSATGRRKHGLGWLPWLIVLLLIAAAVITFLVINALDDDDTDLPTSAPGTAASAAPHPAMEAVS